MVMITIGGSRLSPLSKSMGTGHSSLAGAIQIPILCKDRRCWQRQTVLYGVIPGARICLSAHPIVDMTFQSESRPAKASLEPGGRVINTIPIRGQRRDTSWQTKLDWRGNEETGS